MPITEISFSLTALTEGVRLSKSLEVSARGLTPQIAGQNNKGPDSQTDSFFQNMFLSSHLVASAKGKLNILALGTVLACIY